MVRNQLIRTGLLLISLAAVLMIWDLGSTQAGDSPSLHVLFTGGASGNLEPSG